MAATSASQQQWRAPLHAPPEQELVALFCDFLEHRVATKNFELLRRMTSDFYADHDKTLQEFVELGVNLVAVLPFDESDSAKRAFAASTLMHQQYLRHQPAVSSTSRLDLPRVFLFFEARVATKNMHLLARIYREFCDGCENALLEFVHIGVDAISILPLQLYLSARDRAHWITTQYLPMFPGRQLAVDTDHRSASFDAAPSDHLPPSQAKKRASPDQDQPLRATKRSHHAEIAPIGSEEEALKAIGVEYFRIEATQPWTHIFHEDLTTPFDIDDHADLVVALQRFLVAHGRAIWERTFWMPLSKADDQDLLVERRKRQESAKKVFTRRVIKPAFNALGTQFFLSLDARTQRHEGWWYRKSVVDLGTLYRVKGLSFCLEYLRSQHEERFPNMQVPELRVKSRGHHKWSKSMWSSDLAVKYILTAIRRAKDKRDEALKGRDADADDADGDDDDDDGEDDDVDDDDDE